MRIVTTALMVSLLGVLFTMATDYFFEKYSLGFPISTLIRGSGYFLIIFIPPYLYRRKTAKEARAEEEAS